MKMHALRFLYVATLAHAAPHALSHVHSRAGDAALARMTSWTIPATCPWKISWPLPNTPMPTVDEPSPQLAVFNRPSTIPNTLTVKNYCSYPLYIEPHGTNTNIVQTIASSNGNSQFPFPSAGGVNLKVSKVQGSFAKPVQIEFSVGDGTVWYDISLIDCLGRTGDLRNGDTSACAGHEKGLQMGGQKSRTFQCAAGAFCDDQAYLYEENLCKKQNPVASCQASEGLTVEFCAASRK